jgi:hypothetical protein
MRESFSITLMGGWGKLKNVTSGKNGHSQRVEQTLKNAPLTLNVST